MSQDTLTKTSTIKLAMHLSAGNQANQIVDAIKNNQNFELIAKEQIEEAEILVLAFPDYAVCSDSAEQAAILQKVLLESFLQVQQFVQARMRKKQGKILFILDAKANGMNYSAGAEEDHLNLYTLAAQGGLVGFAKTITKEYSKKGVYANAIYVNWENLQATELLALVEAQANLNEMRGQVIALDGGQWL